MTGIKDLMADRKRVIKIVSIVSVLLVIIFCLLYMNRTYKGYKVVSSIELDSEYNSNYARFGSDLIKYSSDGAAYVTSDGEVWNQAYQMKTPIIDTCGDYAAIADQNSNDIYIFNKEKSIGNVKSQYPIKKVEVADQGVVAVLSEDSESNYIEMFDKDGKSLVQGKTNITENGYPLDFSLSNDGKKMVVSYICLDGTTVKSRVLFYNFDSVGQEEVDNMVGGFNQYTTSIVPKVQFVNDDTAVAFGDDIITIFTIDEKPIIKHEMKVDRQIKKVFYNEEYIGLVYYNNSDDNPFEVVVYNLSGKELASYSYENDYDTVKFDDKNIIFYNDTDCLVVTFGGKVKFKYTFSNQIMDILPEKGKYNYILVDQNSLKKISLK